MAATLAICRQQQAAEAKEYATFFSTLALQCNDDYDSGGLALLWLSEEQLLILEHSRFLQPVQDWLNAMCGGGSAAAAVGHARQHSHTGEAL